MKDLYGEYPSRRGGKKVKGIDPPHDKYVWGTWLWDALIPMRPDLKKLSTATRVGWKKLVGCCTSKGTYPNLTIVPDGRHYLTSQEAAGIVLLALWNSPECVPLPEEKNIKKADRKTLREQISPELNSTSIQASQIASLFDKWMEIGPSVEAERLLTMIRNTQEITSDMTVREVDKISQERRGKPVAPSTLRGWFQSAGIEYQRGAVIQFDKHVCIVEIARGRIKSMNKNAAI